MKTSFNCVCVFFFLHNKIKFLLSHFLFFKRNLNKFNTIEIHFYCINFLKKNTTKTYLYRVYSMYTMETEYIYIHTCQMGYNEAFSSLQMITTCRGCQEHLPIYSIQHYPIKNR